MIKVTVLLGNDVKAKKQFAFTHSNHHTDLLIYADDPAQMKFEYPIKLKGREALYLGAALHNQKAMQTLADVLERWHHTSLNLHNSGNQHNVMICLSHLLDSEELVHIISDLGYAYEVIEIHEQEAPLL